MRGKKREARQVLQCVPLVPLLPAPSCLFLSLHESPSRSCFKNPTFNVLCHEGNPADQPQWRGTPIWLPVPSSRHLANSKVFSSFAAVFMKTKVAPFKSSHCWVLPLLGSLRVTCPGETTGEGEGADYNRSR